MNYPRTDRWGRPLIRLQGQKEPRPCTRVTTVAKTLDNGEALTVWKQRMAVGGAALRPDILHQVAACWPPTDENKARLDGYVAELLEAAAASQGANEGDAAHEVMARVWRGEDFRPIPPLDVVVGAVNELFQHAGLKVFSAHHVERTVVLPEVTVAGSFDVLVEKAGKVYVADLKTGRDLRLAWPSIAVQLALYSRAASIYNWDTDEHEPMPEVDQDHGLVIWMPAGSRKASLHVVDLAAGWKGALAALWVREWRQRDDLSRPARY